MTNTTPYACTDEAARQFDFMIGHWKIHNKRRNKEGNWEEFPATTDGELHLDGCTIIDHYTATFPDGFVMKGITIRAWDSKHKEWNIVWLDNTTPPDWQAMKGTFSSGVGTFLTQHTKTDGTVLLVRFLWDNITETTARWQQSFSEDYGETWATNWVMEFSRP